MQLGIIVLPDNNGELQSIIAKLQGTSTIVVGDINTAGTTDTSDDLDFGGGGAEIEELHVPTAVELKTLLTQVRDESGKESLVEILTSFGAKNLKTLSESDWPVAYAAAQAMLGENSGDDDLDLGDDDGLFGGDDDAPDAEVVKEATQAYAKKHGKEKAVAALKKAGLNSVRGIKSSTDEQRTNLMKIVG